MSDIKNNLNDAAETVEDVAEETSKVFTKSTILEDVNTVINSSARLGFVVAFGTAGFLGGVFTAMRLIDLADRVIAKRKA